MYIGKGKEHERLENVITVTIAMEKAEPFIFEYKGQKFLRFEIAERLNDDQYGNTHAVYVLQRTEAEAASSEVAEPAPEAPKAKRSRKKQ